MTCYNPLGAFRTSAGEIIFSDRADVVGELQLPCGRCVGCRMRRAADWTLRVMHEASMWDKNCFVTLTYARDCEPPNRSLEHRDFQLFMKRLRFSRCGEEVRFFMCGEYGPLNQRPHYHACLFNVDFPDKKFFGTSGSGEAFDTSKELEDLWGHGHVSVQLLVAATAGYCARYIMSKRLGKDAQTFYGDRKPEYAAMSLKPGIGANWYLKFGNSDVYRHDFVVADGVKFRPPKYYDKLQMRKDGFDVISEERERRASEIPSSEKVYDRLRVREIVHEAKISTLKRSME